MKPPTKRQTLKLGQSFPGWKLPTTKFYIIGKQLVQLGHGIQRMQMREDLPPLIARKLGMQRRAIDTAIIALSKLQKAAIAKHTLRYPDDHEFAGKPMPVYERKHDGTPLFRKDSEGKETGEKVVKVGAVDYDDERAMQLEVEELNNQRWLVECPAFAVFAEDDPNFLPELHRFTVVNGAAFDACMELEEGSSATIPD